MGLFDFLKGRGAGSVPQNADLVPRESAPVDGVSSAQAGFMDGADGHGKSLTWANYREPRFTSSYGPFYGGAPGTEISRERGVAAAVTVDFLTSNPLIATAVETFVTQSIGNGLTLSSRPNAEVLGISPETARALSHQIESAWSLYVKSPVECDASQRHNLHTLASTSFRSWLLTGESMALLNYRKGNGALTGTKIQLLDSRQLDESRRVNDMGSVVEGVQFDKVGRLIGYWIRPFVPGNASYAPQPQFVRAKTTWGRTRVLHIFEPLMPNQIRGLSPLIAMLSPAQAKSKLREMTLASAYTQSMMAATITSDMPTKQALDAFRVNDGLQGQDMMGNADPQYQQQKGSDSTLDKWAYETGKFYSDFPVRIQPGVISHLAPNEELKLHRSETPNATYDPFDRSLIREAAKAGGASYEDLSGDYSKTSFSASRLSAELPFRITERRRMAIVIPLYQGVYEAWLEESIDTGAIRLPPGAPDFRMAKDAYCNALWRGKGKVSSDPLKTAQANTLMLQNGLTTYEEVLGEDGKDFEEVLAQLASEKKQFEAAGLPYPPLTSQGVLTVDTSDDGADDDADDKALK